MKNGCYSKTIEELRKMTEDDWNDFEDEEQDFDDDDYPY